MRISGSKLLSLFGSIEKIEWSYNEEKGLSANAPSAIIDDIATVIKIEISQ
jgi:hypothetical protein